MLATKERHTIQTLGRNAASEYTNLIMDSSKPFVEVSAMDWAYRELTKLLEMDDEKQLTWFYNGEFFEAVALFGDAFVSHALYLYYVAKEDARCRT